MKGHEIADTFWTLPDFYFELNKVQSGTGCFGYMYVIFNFHVFSASF